MSGILRQQLLASLRKFDESIESPLANKDLIESILMNIELGLILRDYTVPMLTRIKSYSFQLPRASLESKTQLWALVDEILHSDMMRLI